MGVDGLMSDQLFIEQNAEEITRILLEVQEKAIAEVYALQGDLKAEEFVRLIENLDIKAIIRAKSANAINIFKESHSGMLQSIQGFATLSEETLQSLINYNTETLLSQLDNMGAIIKKEVVKGIISGSPIQTIVDSVRGVNQQLYPNLTNADNTDVNGVQSFNSNGFTVGSGSDFNTSSGTYIYFAIKFN